MKVQSITIEGMHGTDRKTYEFGDLTYLHGPNGIGKSTALQAIQLALLGYIPGTNKTKSGVFRHAKDRAMSVTLNLDDDGRSLMIKRSWVSAKSQIVDKVETIPDGLDVRSLIADIELPLFDFNQFVSMTANQLKDWFINFLPSDEVQTDWKAVLTNGLIDEGVVGADAVVEQVVAEIASLNLSGMDEIRAANSMFKQGQSFKKSEVDRLTSTVRTLVHHDDVGDLNLDQVQAKISEANTFSDYCHQREMAVARNEDKLANLKALESEGITAASANEDPRGVEYLNNIETNQAKVDELRSVKDKLQSELEALLAERGALSAVLRGKGICSFTGKKCDDISRLYEEYVKRDAAISEEAEQLREKINSAVSDLTMAESSIRADTQAHVDLMRKYDLRDKIKSTIVDVPYQNIAGTSADWKQEALRLMDVASKIKANIQYEKLSQDVLKEKYAAELEAEAYKVFVKLTGVNGLQSQAGSSNTFLNFAANLAPKLAALFGDETVGAGFDIQEKANTFSFGIYRNDTYIPYDLLSSGEKCIYVLALSVQLLEYSNSPLKLVMVDDLLDHLDDNRIQQVFDAATSGLGDAQFIFAGVKNVTAEGCVIELC